MLSHRKSLWTLLLAAVAACGGGYSYEVRVNGAALRYSASWNGFHLAYTIERNGFADLFVTNDDWTDCIRLDASTTGSFAWSPDGTYLAFLTKDAASGQVSLCTVRADGSGRRVITGGWRHIGAPLWSPGGVRLAFTTTGFQGHVALRTARIDGGDAVEVDAEPLFLDVVWSPDGTRLAYRAGTSIFGAFQLRSAHADGSGRVVVSGAGDVRAGGIAWCPDGRLLYRADEELSGVVALYSVGADGGDRRRLSGDLDPGREVLGGFECSPDDAIVAFGALRRNDGVTELYVTPWDGVPHLVGEHLASFFDLPDFEWSPDGLWIAFRSSSGRLVTCDPWSWTRIDLDIDVDPGFAWSPDGQHLAYRSAGWLHAAGPDGTWSSAVAAGDPGFVWSPDGDALLFVHGGLYTSGIHGGPASLVADLTVLGQPAWLPVGDRIVFAARDRHGAVDLYRAWPHGGAVRLACDDTAGSWAP